MWQFRSVLLMELLFFHNLTQFISSFRVCIYYYLCKCFMSFKSQALEKKCILH